MRVPISNGRGCGPARRGMSAQLQRQTRGVLADFMSRPSKSRVVEVCIDCCDRVKLRACLQTLAFPIYTCARKTVFVHHQRVVVGGYANMLAPPDSMASISASVHEVLAKRAGRSLRSKYSPAEGSTGPSDFPGFPPTKPPYWLEKVRRARGPCCWAFCL